MTALATLADAMYVEVVFFGGHREVMPMSVYLQMPNASLNGTWTRVMTRTEVIRRRAQARKEQP